MLTDEHNKFSHIFFLLWLLQITGFIWADEAPHNVNFIVENDQGIYHQVIKLSISEIAQLSDRKLLTSTYSPEQMSNSPPPGVSQSVIVGTRSAAKMFQLKQQGGAISTLLTESAFNSLSSKYFGSTSEALARNISPILLDQPVERFLVLGQLLVPSAKTVGVLLGPSNRYKKTIIEKAADDLGLSVEFSEINKESNPVLAINPVMAKSDYFVVLPDQQSINASAAKWILQLSFRHKIPVIGYSKKYVQAGAIGSVYSSPNNIARQLAEVVVSHDKEKTTTGKIYYPDYFSVEFNRSVARSLKINILDDSYYLKHIFEAGGNDL